ncbi:hypothetical protein PMAYCL1PPCAC_31485, partial [Pristionchus mayeri]
MISISPSSVVDSKPKEVAKCTECSSLIINTNGRRNLMNHAMLHCAEKRFKCSLCAHTSVQPRKLNYHFNHSHAGSAAEPIDLKNDLREALWEQWTKKCFLNSGTDEKRSKKVDTRQSQCGVCAKNVSSDDRSLFAHIVDEHSEENLDYDDPQGVKNDYFPSSSSR